MPPSPADHRLVLGSGLAALGEELFFHLRIEAFGDDTGEDAEEDITSKLDPAMVRALLEE